MLMIEDLYQNGGNKRMILYTESSKLNNLAPGLIEVRVGYDNERIRGIQNKSLRNQGKGKKRKSCIEIL